MYCKHFALTAFPFDLTPQPEDLFASATLAEAELRLKHLLELRAIGLVTGEAGSGKTTVCRKVAASLHPGLHRSRLVHRRGHPQTLRLERIAEQPAK